jgi:cytoskeletal protein CcmA (bactofilin family)
MAKTLGSVTTIDGCLAGDIHAVSLVIGRSGTVRGNIFAGSAFVRGQVDGNIYATKLQLCSSCHVEGDILHETIEIVAGAFFKGDCRHSVDPLRDEK